MLPPLLQVKCDLRPRHLGFLRRVLLLAAVGSENIITSAANRLIGEVVQSRRRPLLGPSPS